MNPSDAWIRLIPFEVRPPSLKDNTADVDRVARALARELGGAPLRVCYRLLRAAPALLREFGYRGEALLYQDGPAWEWVGLLPPGGGRACGLALDLGTSTLVLRLLDLQSGEAVGEISFANPQLALGADILTRIHHASRPGGLAELQGLLLQALNPRIADLAAGHGLAPGRILGLAAAGNTTMSHLFLGLEPRWLCREPYIPVINRPGLMRAAELGIAIHPEAPVLVFPNVGSYCGGDLIAGILASGMAEREEVSFLVDVGTNAEVAIGNRDWLVACAGAAGPALEGGVAAMGMMAGPGVIDRVRIDRATGKIRFRTIGDRPPAGICGSGLIDLAAQLFLAGLIDQRGKFVSAACGARLQERDGIPHLLIVPGRETASGKDLFLSQPDMDALLRSKAAMYTILTFVSRTVQVPFAEVARFYVAGTFGAFIDPRSAITLGMIPDLPLETYVTLGNTSIEGAARALVSRAARDRAGRIRDRVTYLELNVNQEFMNLFSAARFIPHTDPALFPSLQK